MFGSISRWLDSNSPQSVFSAAAALIAIFALYVSIKAVRVTRVEVMTNVRKEWETLRNEWSHCLLLYHGADYYYVDTSLDEREKVRQLVEEVERLGSETRDPKDLMRAVSASSRSVDLMRAEASSVRSVIRFLAYTGELLLNGRLSPMDASSILGPDVAAQGRAVRWMVGSAYFYQESVDGPGAELSEWVNMVDQITSWSYHAEQEVVLCLIDILWAEAARNGNIDPDILLKVASHKAETGTGRRCRRRVFRTTRHRGGLRLAITYYRLLRYAQEPPYSSVFGGNRKPSLPVDVAFIKSFGLRWILRRRLKALGLLAVEPGMESVDTAGEPSMSSTSRPS